MFVLDLLKVRNVEMDRQNVQKLRRKQAYYLEKNSLVDVKIRNLLFLNELLHQSSAHIFWLQCSKQEIQLCPKTCKHSSPDHVRTAC